MSQRHQHRWFYLCFGPHRTGGACIYILRFPCIVVSSTKNRWSGLVKTPHDSSFARKTLTSMMMSSVLHTAPWFVNTVFKEEKSRVGPKEEASGAPWLRPVSIHLIQLPLHNGQAVCWHWRHGRLCLNFLLLRILGSSFLPKKKAQWAIRLINWPRDAGAHVIPFFLEGKPWFH